MASPLKNLFFDGAQIRVPLHGPGVHPQFPESLVVAQLRTDAMHEVAVFMATGRAMSATTELLEAAHAALHVLDHAAGKQARLRVIHQLKAAISKAETGVGGAR